MAHYVIRIARNAGIVALFVVAAMLGILSGVLFAYAGDLPQISALDDYAPSTITRVYAANGQVIGEFAAQRRVVVGYDDITPLLASGDHRGRRRRLRPPLRPQHLAHRRAPAIDRHRRAPAARRAPAR